MSLSLSPNTIIPATSLFCCVAPSSNGIDVNFLIDLLVLAFLLSVIHWRFIQAVVYQ